MGEFDHRVQRQRLLLEAEEWAKGIESIHIHSLKSSWYETEESKKDFDNGPVTDTRYNDSTIVREQKGKVIRVFGEKLKGDALIDAYSRAGL